ncbi:MAG: metallophosphoesterase family protein [Planctomycetota bacterium]
MKIAVLGDIHANLPALEAVLEDARQCGVQEIWNIGDSVGYGAFPDQVVQRLTRLGAVSILGNYDHKVLKFPRKRAQWQQSKAKSKFVAFQWAWENLSPASRGLLESLPRQQKLDIEGWRVVLTHGSVADDQEGISEATPVGRLRELAAMARADLIVSGHTHRPFDTCCDGVQFVSVGSVGRPEGDNRACWCLLRIEESDFQLEHRFVEYDIELAAAAMVHNGLPEEFCQMLRMGMSLDDVILSRAAQAGQKCPSDGCCPHIDAVVPLGQNCHFEQEHAEHVTRLALMLFDQLQPLHEYGADQRDLLCAAAMLHDIGWVGGKKKHHKTSRDLILAAEGLKLDKSDRRMVAAIARYHRRALPCTSHRLYGRMKESDRQRLCLLGGMLRLADGLDRSHAGAVQDLHCRVISDQVVVHCYSDAPAEPELQAGARKSDLLSRALGKEIVLDLAPPDPAAQTAWSSRQEGT